MIVQRLQLTQGGHLPCARTSEMQKGRAAGSSGSTATARGRAHQDTKSSLAHRFSRLLTQPAAAPSDDKVGLLMKEVV